MRKQELSLRGVYPALVTPFALKTEELDEEAFRSWSSGSPLSRIDYAQFRRNLSVARANISLTHLD